MTVKNKYAGDQQPGWRLIAILRVCRRFSDHDEAADWYVEQGCLIPSNCLVNGSLPKAFEFTNQNPPAKIKKRIAAKLDSSRVIHFWDATYRRRAREWPDFLATKAELLDLYHPPQLLEADLVKVFGKVPGTFNPPKITYDQLAHLVKVATGCKSWRGSAGRLQKFEGQRSGPTPDTRSLTID